MRVVFLDFDGVIVTTRSYRGAHTIKEPQPWGGTLTRWTNPGALLSPDLVVNVQTLCTLAQASVVISSDWRLHHPLPELVGWLRAAGLSAAVLGVTPDFDIYTRGREILSWMHANGVEPNDVLILEDARDVRPLVSRQIQTTISGPESGFTRRHLARALKLWGLEGSNSGDSA